MDIRDLIPWSRRRDVTVRRGAETDPFLMLHREMNRLFEGFSRGFGLAPFGQERLFGGAGGWPNVEVSETDKEVKVTAELSGLDEKDIEVALAKRKQNVVGT
jgi:HSP20 family protein